MDVLTIIYLIYSLGFIVVGGQPANNWNLLAEKFLEEIKRSGSWDQIAKELNQFSEGPTDPEVNMNPAEMIQRWGYPVEEYQVPTTDGYILTVQRIPHGRFNNISSSSSVKKPVMFLMHGLLASATNWIANLPAQSFAFLLADAGFDVWLGNARGNTYSRKHYQYSPKDSAFWKFSWDEIATYDIPAMVDFALHKSGNQQLYYTGHSQGSLVMFARASEDPEFGRKIKKFFALGPVTTVKHVTGAATIFGKISGIMSTVTGLFGSGEFIPKNDFIDWFSKTFCDSALTFMCTNILFLIGGADTNQLNVTRLPVYMTHTPAGTSTQNIVHFGQMIKSGKFQKHDFGFLGNSVRYGTFSAPEYDLNKFEVPTVLFWAGKDILADPTDVSNLIPKIKNLAGNFFDPELDHLDYVWGLTSAHQVYNPIIKIIQADENGNFA